jgi:hypothetical protein
MSLELIPVAGGDEEMVIRVLQRAWRYQNRWQIRRGVNLTCTACLLLAFSLATMLAMAQKETRFHRYMQKVKGSQGAWQIVRATFWGGTSAEVFNDVAFLPDGRLVVAGNGWGPNLPSVTPTSVIGDDKWSEAPLYRNVKRKTLNDVHPSRAGFLLWLAPDASRPLRLVRFGWGSAVISWLHVGADGALYVSGRCAPNFIQWLSANRVPIAQIPSPEDAPKTEPTGFLYLARFSQGGELDAVLVATEQASADERRMGRESCLRCFSTAQKEALLIAYRRLYRWQGDQVAEIGKVPGGVLLGLDVKRRLAFVGGDRNTHTGREPWRQPFLYAINIDNGQVMWRLWGWDPKEVGSDRYRLVSDSSVRLLTVTPEGDLVIVGWSDGGNSVFTREPMDLDKPVKYGFIDSLWGARVGSFAWLMRLNGETKQFRCGTIWCSFLIAQDRPNSLGVDSLALVEGQTAITGVSAFGLITTPDAWVKLDPATDYIGGAYVAVFSPDFRDLLFCSPLPGLHGPIRCAAFGNRLAIVGHSFGEDSKTPIKDALQPSIGGEADGYLLLAERMF